MAKITGLGGIFFKSPDPKKLAAWYRDMLGLELTDYGAATLSYDAPDHPPCVVWNPFAADTGYFAPSTRELMVNFAVDDLDGFVAMLTQKGITVIGREDYDYGRFAWIMDPDGTKIELWEPKE